MKEIKAFVGHSFAEEDAPLVRKFLDYLDRIARLDPTFSWVHAETAAPQELPAKVLARIEGANVFIGICTKKEQVASQNGSHPFLRYLGITGGFVWKTSDWVIQEIGLAKGRGLELVLLVEQGVRKPGGLQGDVEYIEFDRSAPEKSFNKIIEMIAELSPRASRSVAASADTQASSHAERKNSEGEQAGVTPTADWKRDDYERALTHMMLENDEQGVEAINAAYLATPESAEVDNKASWLANSALMRLVLSEAGDLAALKQLVRENPESPGTLECLALGYQQYDDYLLAGEAFLAAERLEREPEGKRRLMGNAVVCLTKAGQDERAGSILRELRIAAASSVDAERQLLNVLRQVGEWKKNDADLLPVLERYVELVPDDLDARFNLAFKHSEMENNDLALMHYIKVPFQMRPGILWNNLGVAYDQFVMPGKALSAFQHAEQKSDTLAMSNIARKFLSVGFIKQAKEMCEKALGIENYHNNVAHVLAELRDVENQEEKKLSDVRDKAAPKAKFYLEMGRAIAQPEPVGLSNIWQGPNGMLEFTQVNGEVRIAGIYEVSNALANALAGISGGGVSQWLVEYTGKLRGRVVDAIVVRRKVGERPKSLLEAAGNHKAILMVIAADLREIHVVEEPHSAAPSWYTLRAEQMTGLGR